MAAPRPSQRRGTPRPGGAQKVRVASCVQSWLSGGSMPWYFKLEILPGNKKEGKRNYSFSYKEAMKQNLVWGGLDPDISPKAVLG